MITAVGIVVPARNEEQLLQACLEAVEAATLEVEGRGIETALAIVLDSCTHSSRSIAERAVTRPTTHLVEIAAENVGVARATGLRAVLDRLHDHPNETTWVATTDADSEVPPTWLVDQIDLADAGADIIAGIVAVPDWCDWPATVQQRFLAQYEIRPDGTHDHVHGANLGFRASACLSAGGIPAVEYSEDHALLDALASSGARVIRTSSIVVATSARRIARAEEGFSALLARLSGTRPTNV